MPRVPINYENTIMYKWVCNDLNIKDNYVGHTTHFTDRKAHHKSCCNNPTSVYYNLKIYVTIRANGGIENWTMVEIELFPCENGKQARKRERYWYEKLNASMNMICPDRSNKEYYEENKQNISIYKKEYYEENKQNIAIKYKEYYEENKQNIAIKNKEYYEKNKQNIAIYKKQYYEEKSICDCGLTLQRGSVSRHVKTENHKNRIQQKEEI